ncbi:MAG: homoserine dehydrogenase [Gemmatimonadaceae bacterium]
MTARAGSGADAPAPTDVVLLGVGAIGRELLAQLSRAPAGRAARLRVCALVDRSGFVFEPGGLSRRRLAALRALKRDGKPLASAPGGFAAGAAEALARIAAGASSRPVLVDATAADTTAVLEHALASGCDVVLANKIPLAGAQSAVDRLWDAARRHGRRVRHEATVGAGLPVIDTLHKLVESGDRVLRIEGCPSGTLGYLFGELGRGASFSSALRDAMSLGYTEPDPRDDLSGTDVARKALILARLIGFRGDLSSIAVESLVPEHLRAVPLREFLERTEELDASWAARVRAAAARGRVLRYRARVTRRTIRVGIVAVSASDPLGTLSGTDNQFAFTTHRYRRQPLVITGPGAGAAVTAAGVYGDILSLAAPV